MASAALPDLFTDTATIDLGLSVLRGMADRGNEFMQMRHDILLSLRRSLDGDTFRMQTGTSDDNLQENHDMQGIHETSSLDNPQLRSNTDHVGHGVSPYEFMLGPDISFQFDLGENTGLWNDALTGISFNMETDWLNTPYIGADSFDVQTPSVDPDPSSI